MDDIIVFGYNMQDHDERLQRTLSIVGDSGLKLNKEKCEFRKEKLSYFGHIISGPGVSPDLEKIEAIVKLPAPMNVGDLRQMLGMINYLGRYVPNLSTASSR